MTRIRNRELLQHAKTFDAGRHCIGGFLASEKLDGMRCYWDGGVSRGNPASSTPWANTAKDGRLKVQPIATGLWSRYAKVVRAPDWFLDLLPPTPLDGELYLGPGRFEELMSIVRRHEPDNRWHQVRYKAFEIIPDASFHTPGRISNPNYKCDYFTTAEQFRDIAAQTATREHVHPRSFECQLDALSKVCEEAKNEHLSPVWQQKLPMGTDAALAAINDLMELVVARGGEGVMLRKPETVWTPYRTDNLLKVKQEFDAEGTVTGFIWGKGKLEGLFGAMLVNWQGKEFELSGFTDAERVILNIVSDAHMSGEPKKRIEPNCHSPKFPIGSKVTFKFCELTKAGIPRSARYWRPDLNG